MLLNNNISVGNKIRSLIVFGDVEELKILIIIIIKQINIEYESCMPLDQLHALDKNLLKVEPSFSHHFFLISSIILSSLSYLSVKDNINT